MKDSLNFTSGPLFKPLLKFALPVLDAHLQQTMYGAVNLVVVGHFAAAIWFNLSDPVTEDAV